jgi:hypothetical protein
MSQWTPALDSRIEVEGGGAYLFYRQDLANDGDLYNTFQLDLPNSIFTCRIIGVAIHGYVWFASIHTLNQGMEAATLFLDKGGGGNPRLVAIGKPGVTAGFHNFTVATPGCMAYGFDPLEVWYQRGDVVDVQVPPLDDTAAAAADAEIMVQVDRITYRKE